MHGFLGQDARLPDWDTAGVDTTRHHILGQEGHRVRRRHDNEDSLNAITTPIRDDVDHELDGI
jgi:hypothetical protein